MRKKSLFMCMSAVLLVFLIGITACDSNNLGSDNTIDKAETNTLEPSSTAASAMPSAFRLQVSSSGSDTKQKSVSLGTTENLTFDVVSPSPLEMSSNLFITTETLSPSTDLLKIKPVRIAYHNMPQKISYDGYSTIHYLLNGKTYSHSLNEQQRKIFNDLQRKLAEARTYSAARHLKENNSSKGIHNKADTPNLLKTMNADEIKVWLEDKGYEVENLGRRRFKVTRNHNNGETGYNVSFTSVFDANSGRMEPSYTTSKDGKILSEHVSDKTKIKGNQSGKSKLKRSNGEYLLMDITFKKNKN